MNSDSFNPFEQYKGKGPARRQRFVRWFHNNRLTDFAALIDPGEELLSVGAGEAELESQLLCEKFETIYTAEINGERAALAHEKGLESVQSAVPPIPFDDETFNAIVSAGTIEHLPEEQGFIEDSYRCLKPGGKVYVTLPVEVGIGGLLRYLGKNFVHPDRADSPDGLKRYFDYSLAELRKTTERHAHLDVSYEHRYYNYTYAIEDFNRIFSDVTLRGWPIGPLKRFGFILFVIAEKEQKC